MNFELEPPEVSREYLRRALAVDEELHILFEAFAEDARKAFLDRHMNDVGATVTAINATKTRFTISIGFREIDFCYSPVVERSHHYAVVSVILKPTHADYEKPLQLGQFTFDESGTVNLTSRGHQLDMKQPSVVRAAVAHFLVMAVGVGFVPADGLGQP